MSKEKILLVILSSSERIKRYVEHNVMKAAKNKVLANETIDGCIVAAIYGTKFFGSNKKSCDESLKIVAKRVVTGGVATQMELVRLLLKGLYLLKRKSKFIFNKG